MLKRFLQWVGDKSAKYASPTKFLDHNTPQTMSNSDGLDENYVVDFHRGFLGGIPLVQGNYGSNYITLGNAVTSVDVDGDKQEQKQKPVKRIIKPVDALKELETVPTPFSLENLDDKIHIVKLKEKLVTQRYAKMQMADILSRLENRKKWTEHQEFFSKFQNTDGSKIDDLLAKYQLVLKPADIFIPVLPDEAVTAMTAYTEHVEAVTGKKPVFYVIATEDLFQRQNDKLDPILLAQSPFGMYWQILGAWDKEMLLLSEL